ncbi:fibrinogen-like coiled coil protein [uncultured Mediterranean phage]|jgi:hypothetical protein|nr:fibrinogen-like coiled coil protein [uncultured Mediterranean phage]
MAIDISDKTAIAMPIKNMIGIIILVASFVFAYAQITSRLTSLETAKQLMEADLKKAVEFSIKWPRGELGSLPADSEQFMLIEYISKQVEKIQKELDESRHNAVNIQRLQTDMEKAIENIEKLKDKIRENGSH